MKRNPYEVLNIPKNATDAEVKSAYRELAKKYHPDNYHDNPLSDLANEKMNEINTAYDEIMAQRKTGGKNGQQYNTSTEFADIRNLIQTSRIEEAQELLDGVEISKRSAEWYFLNGSVLYKRGWFNDAYTSFATARNMDPNNAEYAAAFAQVNRQRNGSFGGFGGGNFGGYRQRGNGAGGECTICDVCAGLMCADCCCHCFGGGGCC